MDKESKKRILIEKLELELSRAIKNINFSDEEVSIIGLVVEKEMLSQVKIFKVMMNDLRLDIGLSQDDINEIIDLGYSKVYNEIFDKEQDAKKETSLKHQYYYKQDQLEIQEIFHKFCFSYEVVNLFLKDGSQSRGVISLMQASKDESIPFIMFKAFAKKHNKDFEIISSGRYSFKSSEFKIQSEQFTSKDEYSIIEILTTDFETFENDDPARGIAKNFVVHIEGNNVKSLHAVIYSSIIGSYSIRRINPDGTSSNIDILNNNDPKIIIKKII